MATCWPCRHCGESAPDWDFRERQVTVSEKRDSGRQRLLPFGHSSTEISVRGSVGEKPQAELECSRCVILISKSRAFLLLRARADSSREGRKARGPSPQRHATARGPSHFHHRSR